MTFALAVPIAVCPSCDVRFSTDAARKDPRPPPTQPLDFGDLEHVGTWIVGGLIALCFVVYLAFTFAPR